MKKNYCEYCRHWLKDNELAVCTKDIGGVLECFEKNNGVWLNINGDKKMFCQCLEVVQ